MTMYTVVLKRPDDVGTCFSHLDHEIDVEAVVVEAYIGPREAAASARLELSLRDTHDLERLCTLREKDKPRPRDYRVLAVFEGEPKLVLTGWQLLSDPL
jgi:hypothetical protein